MTLEISRLNLVPAEEIHSRLSRLQMRLAASELPLAVVTHRVDLYYLSGSMPDGVLLVPAEGEPTLLVRKSMERTRAESPLADLRPSRGLRTLIEYLQEALGDKSATVGIDLDVLPAANYLTLCDALPKVTWVDTGMELRNLRAVKSTWEIERQREAAKQVEIGYAAAMAAMREGVSENDLSIVLESAMRQAGHHGMVRLRRPGLELNFPHVSFGASAAHPTAFDGPVGAEGLHPASVGGPGSRMLKRGETVMLDILGVSRGYTADIARVFCLGEPPDAVNRAHYFCLEALHRIESLLLPGAPWGEVFAKVDEWARTQGEPSGFMGFGDNRVKFFGHGVGLEVDELPILARNFKQPLEVGNVIAVEPKAFFPDLGPAGIENTYVVTADGPRSLCDWPEGITIVKK